MSRQRTGHVEPIIRALYPRLSLVVIALFALLVTGSASAGQQRIAANVPDAPSPKQQPSTPQEKGKRGFSQTTVTILSRRSFFFPDLAYTRKPLNSGQKFLLAADVTIAPSGLIVTAMSAAISQAKDSWPGYGQGWEAYGKRYGATIALNASTNMLGVFLLPSVLHHDPRYFPLAHGSFAQHVGHALKRMVVTPTDAGGRAVNVSGLLAPLGAEGFSNTYLPDAERTTGKTFERYGIQMAVIAGGNVVKEFWPLIFKRLRMGQSAPGAEPSNLIPER
jgi:hypothetical protein